jgi:hypothetical protein
MQALSPCSLFLPGLFLVAGTYQLSAHIGDHFMAVGWGDAIKSDIRFHLQDSEMNAAFFNTTKTVLTTILSFYFLILLLHAIKKSTRQKTMF